MRDTALGKAIVKFLVLSDDASLNILKISIVRSRKILKTSLGKLLDGDAQLLREGLQPFVGRIRDS